MKLTAILLMAGLSFAGKCEPDEGKWFYHLHEVPTAPSLTTNIVDYNADGEIDVRDGVFMGLDRDNNGILEYVQYYKFTTFVKYENGKDRFINFMLESKPTEQWFDFDGDGLYDSKLYRNGPVMPTLPDSTESLDSTPRIKTTFRDGKWSE